MITEVDTEAREEDLAKLEKKVATDRKKIEVKRDTDLATRQEKLENDLAELEDEGAKSDQRRKVREAGERELKNIRDRAQKELDRLEEVWTRFKNLKVQDLEGDENLYREMRDRYGMYFKGYMGATAIQKRLETFDLKAEYDKLTDIAENGKGQKKTRAIKRLKVVNSFLNTNNNPTSMVLDCIPVIPPDLRPMVQLDGGRFATSDLNDLYRRVINRNNRLKRLVDLGAPEIIVNNEKRMLQEAVDALFDNGRRGRPVTGPGNRALKSLSDMLKGKQGRFRQNLLGKRVDYSGRSVIVAGPQLKLHQCGLPKQMALELFKPFVMKRLVDLNHAQNIKSAKRMVERSRSVVWDVLEEVIAEHPVLLNRAPTLHRLGIQAFEPQLIEGKAIQIHPLVCTAFNADFDGDQMAVHVPLSAEAQAEARVLMLSSNNILSPASGRPLTAPTQDMVLGLFFLTSIRDNQVGEGRAFTSISEALMAFEQKTLSLQAKIKIRLNVNGELETKETTLGRALFNEVLPETFPFVDYEVTKKGLGAIVDNLAESYPKVVVAKVLDDLKELGFRWATRAGATIGIVDVVTPARKREILEGYESKADKVQSQYEKGLITDDERRQELIEIWTQATNEVAKEMEDNFPRTNPVWMMVFSGARGNMMQIRQIAGMRGLVANPKGEIIPRPIKSNFREGLSVLEYFISTHGARKGLADTALRTADAGYLTRRLCDVAQDVIIREEDCETDRGLTLAIGSVVGGKLTRGDYVETSIYGRVLVEDVVADGKTIVTAGSDLGDRLINDLIAAGVSEVKVRSVLTCDSKVGLCAKCYGRSMATGKLVDVGEAVGIIAAQSIGEPGTQLTMRTFHTGGAATASGDITHGLPRVVELFEARTPKGVAPIAEAAGVVSFLEDSKGKKIIVTPEDGGEAVAYPITRRQKLLVEEGVKVGVGQQMVVGAIDPKQVLRILGPRATQAHLVEEIQEVYRSQGVSIHDKHIEIVVKQMLRRITVLEPGDTDLLPGELVDQLRFQAANREAVQKGGKAASGRPELMGITKASLATESWLSAASFQETTRVLTDAALSEKSDPLLGLKENVIIGKLIPAGTGLARYRNVRIEPTEEAKANAVAMYEQDFDYTQFESTGSGEAVRLDEFDTGTR